MGNHLSTLIPLKLDKWQDFFEWNEYGRFTVRLIPKGILIFWTTFEVILGTKWASNFWPGQIGLGAAYHVDEEEEDEGW